MPSKKPEAKNLAQRLLELGYKHERKHWQRRPEVLLHPNIPKPMHAMAPRLLLGQKWWDRVRQTAYASTDFHCIACGVPKHLAQYRKLLEAHEIYQIDYPKGRMVYIEAVPLCHACHCYIHSGRMQALVLSGKMSLIKEASILAHGETILKAAKLQKPEYRGLIARWEDWRLVINGELYEPRFKNLREWEAYHSSQNHDSPIEDE